MKRRIGWTVASLVVPTALGLTSLLAAGAARAQEGIITLESRPDVAALYLGDTAYLYDELTLPAGMAVHIVLPATTMRDSLIIQENGERLSTYRLIGGGQSSAPPVSVYNSAVLTPEIAGSDPLIVTWDPPAGDETRTVVLQYLATGAGWEPLYDMTILSESGGTSVTMFGFDARITNRSLLLDDANLRLVAGMPGADSDYHPDMTLTQVNVGYFEPPTGTAGSPVEINHVYEVGALHVPTGSVLRHNLLYQELAARRLLVWDARFGQRTDVIYKLQNTTGMPFVAGDVHAYQDGLYVGQDAIEWTPAGSEGSITVAGLSTIRARRTESVEDIGSFNDSRYRHDIELSITNHGGESVDLVVLDEWNRSGQAFTFSEEPQRQGNNVLRWEVTIPAGESLDITYTFIVD